MRLVRLQTVSAAQATSDVGALETWVIRGKSREVIIARLMSWFCHVQKEKFGSFLGSWGQEPSIYRIKS